MIIVKNDGSRIIKVSIVTFKKTELEIWVEGAKEPIFLPYSQISTMS